MTLALDTSALVARHLAIPAREVATEAMDADSEWCASALALTEALVLIDRLTDEPELRDDLEDAVRLDWDRLAVVPVDAACLDRASSAARSWRRGARTRPRATRSSSVSGAGPSGSSGPSCAAGRPATVMTVRSPHSARRTAAATLARNSRMLTLCTSSQ